MSIKEKKNLSFLKSDCAPVSTVKTDDMQDLVNTVNNVLSALTSGKCMENIDFNQLKKTSLIITYLL
jgi:hypothetical protein